MGTLRVGIAYEPRLYADLIAQVFDGVRSVTVVEPPFSGVDVVVFPLTDAGKPDMDVLRGTAPRGAKLVAVSPTLDRGLVRLPGAGTWVEVRPFGLEEMLSEVVAGRERPVTIPMQVTRPARPAVRVDRQRVKRPARRWPKLVPVRPWAVAFAALVVLISFSVSAVVVSTQSLPGEPLYSIKRLTESVQLALAPPASMADLHATFAQRRMEEIAALAHQGILTPEIVKDLESELQAALDVSQNLPASEQKALLQNLAVLTQEHEVLLMEIARQTEQASVAQALENAATLLAAKREQIQEALDKIVVVLPTSTAPRTQPSPTRTSPGPSRTPQPTGLTPIPLDATFTVQPPGQNQGPEPTQSPEPTQTPGPTLTQAQTPVPTSTRAETPVPTQTPAPTQTPVPTQTPDPTPDLTPKPTKSHVPPGQTHTPQPPGQTRTPPAPTETPTPAGATFRPQHRSAVGSNTSLRAFTSLRAGSPFASGSRAHLPTSRAN